MARYEIQNSLWWLGMVGFDGIRQDTWPYVGKTFWREWMQAIKAEYPSTSVVGEVFNGDPTVTSFFLGGRTAHDGVDDSSRFRVRLSHVLQIARGVCSR